MLTYRQPTASLPQWWLMDTDAPMPSRVVPSIGHENCRHREYRLTCRQYDRLLARAAGECEVCGKPDRENCFGKLFIDHETQLGKWAVRGLLCRRCNGNIHFPSRQSQRVAAYNANAFYRTLAAEAGVINLCPPEPPMWTALRDHTQRPWRREPEGWWPHHPRPTLVQPVTWKSLLFMTGPFNLSPSNLPASTPPKAGGPQDQLRRRVLALPPFAVPSQALPTERS